MQRAEALRRADDLLIGLIRDGMEELYGVPPDSIARAAMRARERVADMIELGADMDNLKTVLSTQAQRNDPFYIPPHLRRTHGDSSS